MKHCIRYYANTVYVAEILIDRQIVHKSTAFWGEIEKSFNSKVELVACY